MASGRLKFCSVRLILTFLLGLSLAWASPFVEVGHPRQMRGVWVASVANMHWPSKSGLEMLEQQQELRQILEAMAKARCNALFLQVRPEGDALYQSTQEPWSRFLSGQQGQSPGYDPLEFAIREAHQRNIEVHAWLNPYRARSLPETTQALVEPHLGVLFPEQVVRYGKLLWMDPAGDEVRPRLVEVCRDLASRYDLDGLHFDDYFYPYPEEGQEFPDQAPDPENRDDWRRQQVNLAISEVRQCLLEEKPHLCFGISPFGIPAPHKPEGISGLDQYAKLYADTQYWMDQGWVDYLAPQLYWPISRRAQAYDVLWRWWCEHARQGRPIFAGINLAALGTKEEWSLSEIQNELALTASSGYLLWNIAPLLEDRLGIRDQVLAQQPVALTPPLARCQGHQVEPPLLVRQGRRYRLANRDPVPERAFTVYRKTAGGWQLEQIISPSAPAWVIQPGCWAIATVSREGLESLAVQLDEL